MLPLLKLLQMQPRMAPQASSSGKNNFTGDLVHRVPPFFWAKKGFSSIVN